MGLPVLLYVFIAALHYCGAQSGGSGGGGSGEKPSTSAVFLGNLTTKAHDVRGSVFALDERTLMLTEFSYDGGAPAVRFHVARGPSVDSPDFWFLLDENGSNERLRAYVEETIVLVLPAEVTIHTIDWFSVRDVSIDVSFGVLQIPDNISIDTAEPQAAERVMLGLEFDNYTVNEERSVQVCAQVMNGLLSSTITLQLLTASPLNSETPATADVDYSSVPARFTSGRLTFSSFSTRQCVSIRTAFDSQVEDTEDFLVQLQVIGPLFLDVELARTNATIFILDNDVVEIGFSQRSYTANEEDDFVEVCAIITRGTLQTSRFIQVTVNTQDGTATAPDDYSATSVELTFSRIQRRACVLIALVNDEFYDNEFGSMSFFVTLESNDSAVLLRRTQASVIIRENDVLVIGLERENITVTEAIRRVEVCAVVLNGTIQQNSSANALVRFSTRDGTATDSRFRDGDFFGFTERQVTISKNGTGCVSVQVRDDSITEGPEQFFVNLSAPFGSGIIIQQPSRATVTIVDDDVAVFGFTQTEYSVTEGNRVEVQLVFLQGFLDFRFNVRVFSMDRSATSIHPQDYQPLNTSRMITGSSRFFQITTVEDKVDEDPETFSLRLELAEDNNLIPLSLVDQAVVTILDDDGITVGLEDTAYSVPENAGMIEICAILLEGALERTTNVTISTIDGSAIAPADYSAVSIVLTFDESVSRSCASIPIELDNTIEAEEFFSVSITTTDPDITLMTKSARVTISDRSEVVIGFKTVVYEVSEGQQQEFCVAVQDGTLESPVEVTVTTEDGTALAPGDYFSGALRIIFTEEADQMCVHIPIVNDTTVEGTENFFAKLSTEDLRISLLPATAVITILDDDDEEGSNGAAEFCLPHQEATVSVRAVLSGGSGAAGNHCPTATGLQSSFTQFLEDEILQTSSFGPGCAFLSAGLSSCVTRSGRTIAAITADFTCNGQCIQANSGALENTQTSNTHRQLLMDTIAQEQSVFTTFEGGTVRITYFRRGQQSAITAVCSAGAADENDLCNCPADCFSSKTI